VIRRFGSEAQKEKYLEALLAGRFFGTMALTEPQAGSSLSDITTSAEPNPDGSYSITGNKIFISAGDHELSREHRAPRAGEDPGRPARRQGHLAVHRAQVPRERRRQPGPRNDVTLAGLIHKMGYRGTTSTMLAFGEQGQCRRRTGR
jgi:alkylation response protein AidB-like acyl-CoA dehydrogenase